MKRCSSLRVITPVGAGVSTVNEYAYMFTNVYWPVLNRADPKNSTPVFHPKPSVYPANSRPRSGLALI